MVTGGTYVQAYNAQIAVDAAAQVIVAQAVTNQAPDVQHLVPILERMERVLGEMPGYMSADSGYYSALNVQECEARGTDPHIAVGRVPHAGTTEVTPPRVASPLKTTMRAKLDSSDGRAIYARRKVIAEPPFGQIKAAQGFRRFSLRGLTKVRCEWALVCLTHNLLKLFRSSARTVTLWGAAPA